ncbi:hypothetical protein BDV11DRAFT_190400 [Aspergillus similis]
MSLLPRGSQTIHRSLFNHLFPLGLVIPEIIQKLLLPLLSFALFSLSLLHACLLVLTSYYDSRIVSPHY